MNKDIKITYGNFVVHSPEDSDIARGNVLVGERYGFLTAVRFLGVEARTDGKQKRVIWAWDCECGNRIYSAANSIRSGLKISCGCKLIEARHQKSLGRSGYAQEYRAWCNMKARCDNPKNPAYVRYGSRGITYCRAWESFDAFIADMGKSPSEAHTLDRKDNDDGYYKNNCRWVTRDIQQRNRGSFNRRLVFRGELHVLKDVADTLGIGDRVLRRLLLGGYTLEEIEVGIENGADFRTWQSKHNLSPEDVFQ